MLDKNIKARWIKALRSRKYQQAQGRLREMDIGYCCLGVLCDVIEPRGWELNETWHHSLAEGDIRLSRKMRRKTGLKWHEETMLIEMNDGDTEENMAPLGFLAISRWIEKNL